MARREPEREDPTVEPGARGVGSIDSRMDRDWSVPFEDLSKDFVLRGCGRSEFAGAQRPTLGDYPLLARIGQGGMGVVYFAIHPRLESEVAIKILPEEVYARQPDLRRRFVREARLAAQLRSDFLVRVLDVDRDRTSGLYYLVMEYVSGISAGKWMRTAGTPGAAGAPEQPSLDICIAATRGLCTAHERGTIHRDVKPDNILIPTGEGGYQLTMAKLADLGLACPAEAAETADERLTSTKATFMGTPGYAAPEQLKDPTRAKKPADVFSMGATLYALLTKDAPFEGQAMEAVFKTMEGKYQPVRDKRPDVTSSTAALIDVCLRQEPDKRYPDAFALLEALRLCREGVGRAGAARGEMLTTDIQGLTARSEVGESVHTDKSDEGQASSGRLVLEGGPPGAQVTLRRRGTEPRSYVVALDAAGRFERDHVEQGVYDVTATRQGFHPFASTLEVAVGASVSAKVGMRERDGILSIDSDPPGAEILVDGVSAGTTPVSGLAVPPGSRTLTLTLPGHDRLVRTIVVRGGTTTQLGVLTLEPLGRLDLSGLPPDVRFELDGAAVQSGAELRPGSYTLRASREGFEPQEARVVIAAGQAAAPKLEPWRREGWALVSDLERWDATSSDDRRRVARAVAAKLGSFEFRALEMFEAGGSRHEVAIFVHRASGLEFVLVPGGHFEMGSEPGEPGRRPDERRHAVTVQPFLMARSQAPQAVWESAMRTNPSHFRGPLLPVHNVTHEDAARFCETTGLALPTEAQWEYACRAGSPTAWACGADPAELTAHAWFCANAGDGPRPGGGRRANAFGLFDLHGNVWEWCADAYTEYPFEGEEAVAPALASSGTSYRVFRGGGWADPPERLRSAQRSAFRPDFRFFDLGFRPVRAVTPDLVAEPAPPPSSAKSVPTPIAVPPATTPAPPSPPRPAEPQASAAGPRLVDDVERWDAATSAERRRAAEELAGRVYDFLFASLARFEAGGVRHEVALYRHGPTDTEFVLIPGGRPLPPALSGQPVAEPAADARVAPFLRARTPVTQATWRRVMGGSPSTFSGERLPVEQVDLAAAESFCRRFVMALPTEQQWEHACRAGTSGPWTCGDPALLPEFAWFDRNAGASTHPVGEKKPNAFGLLDIIGNVWEWCRPELVVPARDPRCRGGAWTSDVRQLQSSWRLSYPAATRMGILGLRPIREVLAGEVTRR